MEEGQKEYFVDQDSIVRQIWGKSDVILFIFAGSAAEFALNKAVDWLYFTGRLPADPLGRLFSTVSYARTIVFSERKGALRAIDAMTAIHASVESKRATKIPDWAYLDVLFMLIDYSIRAYELLERPLSVAEKNEVFAVFKQVGERMGLTGLPRTFEEWLVRRQVHLEKDLEPSNYTDDLFHQYRKHLGWLRYQMLREAQALVVPAAVRKLLATQNVSFLRPLLPIYKLTRCLRVDWMLKGLLLPSSYKKEIMSLDFHPRQNGISITG